MPTLLNYKTRFLPDSSQARAKRGKFIRDFDLEEPLLVRESIDNTPSKEDLIMSGAFGQTISFSDY